MAAHTPNPERLEFKAELKQLLDLIIHSLYTRKEIFLRELISNAADAIDRVRFEALTRPDLLEGNSDWKIRLLPDPLNGTLTVSDNGVGMSRAGVVEDLGTIARSGTRAFLEGLRAADVKERPELIGQFGVGFYASFMVADRVTVVSRRAGPHEDGVRWESDGQGAFTVEPCLKETRGTDVTLHLRDDAKEFLDTWRLREAVKRYSDFVEHPVVADLAAEKDGKKTTTEEVLNSRKAIWLRPKAEIKDEEYREFYHQIAHDPDDPLKTVHLAAEGTMEFRALLFLPARKPFDFFYREPRSSIRLYVRRVLIMSECEELLPPWLRFVRGVVDSADLPLNVSRELLQHNPILTRIRSSLVARVFKTLEDMKTGEYDTYAKFYAEFGPVLKEGLGPDVANRERIADLLLFESTKTDAGKYTTLADYVGRMGADQKVIHYLVGEARASAEHSPYLEACRARGEEVLLCTDPIDEYVLEALREYKGKELKPVDRGAPPEDPVTEPARKAAAETFAGLLGRLQELLNEVKEVRLSARLKESAACLVADEGGPSAQVERMMRRLGRTDVPPAQRILELNAGHPLVQALQRIHAANREDARIETYAALLYDQALLAEGARVKDPAAFARRLNEVLLRDAR